MRRSRQRFNEQIDRLIAGHPTTRDQGYLVASLIDPLRSESATDGSSTEELVPLLALEAEATSVPGRVTTRTRQPLIARWRRRAVLSTFISTLLGKFLVGSVALAATTGGLAATGNLPDPAQAWFAQNLSHVGIEIPNPDTDDRSGAVLDVIEGTDPADRDQEFGEEVADTASDGVSSEYRDEADDLADNEGQVAEDYKPSDVPSGAPGGYGDGQP